MTNTHKNNYNKLNKNNNKKQTEQNLKYKTT